MPDRKLVSKLITRARALGRQYYAETGRPLGVTGEIAEHEAATRLKLRLARVRQAGHDAEESRRGQRTKLIQIKGRASAWPPRRGARLGSISFNQPWDSVVLVLLDDTLTLRAIHRAERQALKKALTAPGSKARNVRGQLSISKFVAIGRKVWP